MDNTELRHHGTRGMKWGIRRYQNPDGSLTEEGRRRYGVGSGRDTRSSGKPGAKLTIFGKKKGSAKSDNSEEDEKAKLEAKKQEVLNSRSAKAVYENAHLFSDQELQTAYNRLNLERNIANLVPHEVSKGQQYAKKFVETGKTVEEVAKTGMSMYNNIARLYNTFSVSGRAKPLPIIRDNDANKSKATEREELKDKAKSFAEKMAEREQRKTTEAQNKAAKAEAKAAEAEAKARTKTANAQAKAAESEAKAQAKAAGAEAKAQAKAAKESAKSASNNKKETVYEGEIFDGPKTSTSSNTKTKSDPDIIDLKDLGGGTYGVGRDYVSTYVQSNTSPVSSANTAAGRQYIAGLLEEPKK